MATKTKESKSNSSDKSMIKGLSGINAIPKIIKGENVIVLSVKDWKAVQTKINTLKKKESKLKLLESVGNRIRAAVKDVKDIESGKKKGQSLDSLIKELRAK